MVIRKNSCHLLKQTLSFIALSLLLRIHTYKINKIACLAKHYSDHEHRGLPVSKIIFSEKSLSVHILCVCLSICLVPFRPIPKKSAKQKILLYIKLSGAKPSQVYIILKSHIKVPSLSESVLRSCVCKNTQNVPAKQILCSDKYMYSTFQSIIKICIFQKLRKLHFNSLLGIVARSCFNLQVAILLCCLRRCLLQKPHKMDAHKRELRQIQSFIHDLFFSPCTY